MLFYHSSLTFTVLAALLNVETVFGFNQNMFRGVPSSFDFPTDDDRVEILDNLNREESGLRPRAKGYPIAGMRCLNYDEELQNSAYMRAISCDGLRQENFESPEKYSQVFETVYVSETATAPSYDDILMSYFFQSADFNYNTLTGDCTPACNEYKSMMFHDNDAVGCATIKCEQIDAIDNREGYVSVCHFGAKSNYSLTGPAYQAEENCSACTCPSDKRICNAAGLCCVSDDPYAPDCSGSTPWPSDSNFTESVTFEPDFNTTDIYNTTESYNDTTGFDNSTGITEFPIDTTPATPRPTGACPDSRPDCRPELCSIEPGKYLVECRGTCNNCDGTECYDSKTFNCPLYASEAVGWCKRYSSRMTLRCPKSCQQCDALTTPQPGPTTPMPDSCQDDPGYNCSLELCQRAPGDYLPRCRRTCFNCEGTVCYDSKAFSCSYYGSLSNFCQKYENRMTQLCPQTCNYCTKVLESTATPIPELTTTEVYQSQCTEPEESCANVTISMCQTEPGVYLAKCKLTCRNCEGDCYDSTKIKCSSFSNKHCTVFKQLPKYCPVLCGNNCTTPIE